MKEMSSEQRGLNLCSQRKERILSHFLLFITHKHKPNNLCLYCTDQSHESLFTADSRQTKYRVHQCLSVFHSDLTKQEKHCIVCIHPLYYLSVGTTHYMRSKHTDLPYCQVKSL